MGLTMKALDDNDRRAIFLLNTMSDFADRYESETRFQKIAEKNDHMRELWSEYATLMGECLTTNQSSPELPSKEDYFNSRVRLAIGYGAGKEWSEPLFKCPFCGGNVRRKEDYLMTSFPPVFIYRCDRCKDQDIHE